jgi:hypothetical protein
MPDNTGQAPTPTDTPVVPVTTETTQPVTATTEQATKAEQTMTLEAALRELTEARKEAAKYRTSAKQIEKAKAEAEEAALKEQGDFKKLYEKLKADHEQSQADLAKERRATMQRTVADRVKLPLKLATRLTGETEAEMEADAREILGALPGQVLGNDARPGSNGATGPVSIGGMPLEQAAQWLGVKKEHIK